MNIPMTGFKEKYIEEKGLRDAKNVLSVKVCLLDRNGENTAGRTLVMQEEQLGFCME